MYVPHYISWKTIKACRIILRTVFEILSGSRNVYRWKPWHCNSFCLVSLLQCTLPSKVNRAVAFVHYIRKACPKVIFSLCKLSIQLLFVVIFRGLYILHTLNIIRSDFSYYVTSWYCKNFVQQFSNYLVFISFGISHFCVNESNTYKFH